MDLNDEKRMSPIIVSDSVGLNNLILPLYSHLLNDLKLDRKNLL